MRHNLPPITFFGLLGLYSVYSYTQVDPNLVLSSHPLLWRIQQELWQIGYHQRLISTVIYVILVSLLFGVYLLLLKQLKSIPWRRWLVVFVAVLAVSYPALSHDVFNYAMNAKIVWQYGQNPHVTTATQFPNDPWLAYMHNVHTPAPYGYGWTALSLLPGWLAGPHIKLNLFLFRVLMITALALLLWLQSKLQPKKDEWSLAAFALNPLVLIETVSTIHNDVVMMALLFGAMFLGQKAIAQKKWWLGVGSVALFGLSVSTKFASLMFIIGLLMYGWSRYRKGRLSFGANQSVAHFIPLLSARSQRFLPWYLIWPLSFVPLIKEKPLQYLWLLFSQSALLSYAPYLYTGSYSPQSLVLRTLIIFLPPLSYLLVWGITSRQKGA